MFLQLFSDAEGAIKGDCGRPLGEGAFSPGGAPKNLYSSLSANE